MLFNLISSHLSCFLIFVAEELLYVFGVSRHLLYDRLLSEGCVDVHRLQQRVDLRDQVLVAAHNQTHPCEMRNHVSGFGVCTARPLHGCIELSVLVLDAVLGDPVLFRIVLHHEQGNH